MVQPNPPDDALGVNELITARRRWDAEMAETRRRWDARYPIAAERSPVPDTPDRDTPDRDDDTDTPDPLGHLPAVDPDALDLTAYDSLAEQTDKLTPADDELAQPPQSPRWVPPQAAP